MPLINFIYALPSVGKAYTRPRQLGRFFILQRRITQKAALDLFLLDSEMSLFSGVALIFLTRPVLSVAARQQSNTDQQIALRNRGSARTRSPRRVRGRRKASDSLIRHARERILTRLRGAAANLKAAPTTTGLPPLHHQNLGRISCCSICARVYQR